MHSWFLLQCPFKGRQKFFKIGNKDTPLLSVTPLYK
jgi:hypothetical protein